MARHGTASLSYLNRAIRGGDGRGQPFEFVGAVNDDLIALLPPTPIPSADLIARFTRRATGTKPSHCVGWRACNENGLRRSRRHRTISLQGIGGMQRNEGT